MSGGAIETSPADRRLPPRVLRGARRVLRRIDGMRNDAARIESYLSSTADPRLHIGAGETPLPGWLNVDLQPVVDGVVRMDATKPFPLPTASMRVVYSEHMIEHIPYAAGQAMLRECHRVLRPGGRIRIATPDLNFLAALLARPGDELHARYIDWAVARFTPELDTPAAGYVINTYVRTWGHSFIYDPDTMRIALESAGFADVEQVTLGESEDDDLRGLEHDDRMPDGFLDLESMVVEARRP